MFDPEASRSYGYFGMVVIPIELTPDRSASGPISLRARMDIGVCEDICIPMSVQLQAELPNSGSRDPAITASLAHRPTSGAAAGLRSATCSVELISDGLRISADLDLPQQGGDEIVVLNCPINQSGSTRPNQPARAAT